MNQDHRETHVLLGAYVLGGLDPADRARVEAHLPRCPDCQVELSRAAALPGLLRRITSVPEPEPQNGPSAAQTLQPRLIARLEAQRARRRRATLVGLLAAAVLAVALAVAPQVLRPPTTDVVSILILQPAAGAATAEAALTAKPWGTSVALTAARLPVTGPFTLEITSRNGVQERAATWGTTGDGRAQVTGATSVPPANITRVVVRGPDGILLRSS